MTPWALQYQRWMMTHQLTYLQFSMIQISQSLNFINGGNSYCYGNYTNTNPSYNLWLNSKYKCRWQQITECTVESGIMSRLEGLQLTIDQPWYDCDALDQLMEFRIFHKYLTSWFNLWCVRNYMARDAILCYLCTKGYALHDEIVADPVLKVYWWELLWYFESTLDTEVGPQVQVYDLKIIHKKYEETPCELVPIIHQMASHAHIGDGSARAIEFEVQWHFIRALNSDEMELRCRLLTAPLTATTNELLTIAESFYAIEHVAQHMSVGGSKSVYAVCTSYQQWQHQEKTTLNNQCGNSTKHHAPGCAICPAWDFECNKCGHIGHWMSECRGGAPPH